MRVILTGFQVMQLLSVCDHAASAQVVVYQDNDGTHRAHARLFDSRDAVYLPRDAGEAKALADEKAARQVKIDQAMSAMKGD